VNEIDFLFFSNILCLVSFHLDEKLVKWPLSFQVPPPELTETCWMTSGAWVTFVLLMSSLKENDAGHERD
jgi:hypothetical protein